MAHMKHARWAGRLSAILALLLAVGPGAPLAFAGGSTPTAGSVEVHSDPVGAEVYLDGRFEGTTPLRVESVTPGPHRVRVVKQGFLENRRIVDVVAGGSHDVNVPLTEHRGARLQVDPGSSGGGGGSKKALLIGLGAVAVGAGLFLALRGSNAAPTASASASPTTGLASATRISFSAQGSDPDGDALTYSWDFGDGASSTGATATHTYARAGNYAATVTVSDGEDSVTSTASVTIRDLAGTWNGTIQFGGTGFPFQFQLTQSGSSLGGTYSDPDGPGSVSGGVSAPLAVSITVSQPPFQPFTFSGDANAAVTTITGSVFGLPFTMSR